MSAATEASLITALIFGLIAGSTLAANGSKGGGKGHTKATASACTVDGNVVTGHSLPTDEVINFFVTDSRGTWGWVLGFSGSGTWSVTVPARTGPATYEFGGRTYGNDGTKYDVFSSCSA